MFVQYVDIKVTWEMCNVSVHLGTANWAMAIANHNDIKTRNAKRLEERSLLRERQSTSGTGRCSMRDTSGRYIDGRRWNNMLPLNIITIVHKLMYTQIHIVVLCGTYDP